MRQMNKLTQARINSAKPKARPYSLADGGGLGLLVNPNGSRYWRFRYRFAGTAKMISMGVYPETGLKAARRQRTWARNLLFNKQPPVDPSAERQAYKAAEADAFGFVATDWFENKQQHLAKVTRERNQFLIDRLSDRIGRIRISQIETPHVKRAVLSIQKHHGIETARRALGIASRVFSYAIADGKAEFDPTAGLKETLKSRKTKHRAALTKPRAVARLMRAIDSFSGYGPTAAGLKLLAFNFTRPTEIRLGLWEEVDLDSGLWEIPAERMKMRRKNPHPHLLPLASQSVAILKELRKATEESQWVFPGPGYDRPLSENAFNNALKKLGFGGEIHTAHGFRSTASTLLHEMNFPSEVIETQLAHSRGSVSGIYNRAHLLPQRRKMLQHWADYLEQLRLGGQIVPLKSERGSKASDGNSN